MHEQLQSRVARSIFARACSTIAVVVLLVLWIPASVFAEPVFTFTARGNGHGVGMSQYGALGFALQGYAYRHMLQHYYQGTSLSSVPSGSTMRVALQATDLPAQSWTLTAHNGPMRVDWSQRTESSYLQLGRGVPYRFSTGGSTSDVTITDLSSGQVVRTLPGALWVNVFEFDSSQPGSMGLLRVHDASGPFSRADMLYPGWISLVRGGGSSQGMLHLRNIVQMEDYVKCVTPREMPASWHHEAVKAQAVAARSYAYYSKKPASAFDVWCTVSSQVYNGWGAWRDGRAARHNETAPGRGGDWLSDPAVDATRGLIVTYQGQPVATYFFSTSGGYTENSENVWSTALPYARGVPDPFEYLAGSPSHSLPGVTLTASEVRARLLDEGFTAAEVPAAISNIRVTKRGASGRVLELRLTGVAGEERTLDRAQVRRFRTAISRSASYTSGWNTTWFYVNPKSERVAGPDRHSTSVQASKRAFGTSEHVVLVGGRAPADALAAAPFAGSLPNGAPILLTERERLTPAVQEEVERLGASKVYIIGGELAVSQAVQAELSQMPQLQGPGRIERIGGNSRYDTAGMLAERVLELAPGNRVFVVSGERLPDALAISPVAYALRVPIVPVQSSVVPAGSAEVLMRADVTRSLVVGGVAAVGEGVLSNLPDPERIAAGSNRYDTAVRVARWAKLNEGARDDIVYVASGVSLVDALAAAPLIGAGRHTVLFSRRHALPSETADALHADRSRVRGVRMLGGEGALGNGVEASIERTLE